MSGVRPPRLIERVLEWALPSGLSGEATLGDLAEEFERRARVSALRARLWYVGQAVSVVAWGVYTNRGLGGGDSDLLMDVRWSVRLLLKHPGFALGVVAVLALGFGANVAVFAVVDGTFRNTSWWGEPERTIAIAPDRRFSFGNLTLYEDEQAAYRSVGGYAELAFALRTDGAESESVNGVRISPRIFRELATQPLLGRALAEEDAVQGTEAVAVIGEALWRRSFGADPGVVGSRIELSGAPVTVVGVQGAGARAPGGRAEVWVPLTMDSRDDDYWKAHDLTLVGVLRDGATLDDAAAELVAFDDRLTRLFPTFYPPGFGQETRRVERADESQRRLISTPLLLLLGGTGLLLLVTALNVGNLLLGRAIERRTELAVRTAIGAGRGRIVRQLFVEGAVLTVLAVGVGLGGAAWVGPWIAGLFVGEATVAASSVLTPGVLLFSGAVFLVAWLLLSGVPTAHFLRTSAARPSVKPASGAGTQRVLVTVQASLATLLLVSATLLVATVGNLRDVPLGFDPEGMLTVELSPPEDRVATVPAARGLYDRLVERVSALPGVESAGLTGWLPLRAQAPTTPINLRTAPVEPAQALTVPRQLVDPGFFEAFGIEPLEGRLLGTEDRGWDPTAVVVNRTLADMLWPRGRAVGQQVAIDPHAWDRWATVVGVVPDVRAGDITDAPGPQIYVPLAELPARDVTLVVRSAAGAPPDLASSVRRAVAEVDPLVPVRSVTWMAVVVRTAYSVSWVIMGLLVLLALLATALGAIGVYAVLAHHVTVRRREMGVRMALGAEPGALVGSVVRSGLLLAGVGIVLGCGGAVVAARFLDSLLFGVSGLAPGAYAAAALALSLAAVLAAWVPAARAGRLPPAEVLRE